MILDETALVIDETQRMVSRNLALPEPSPKEKPVLSNMLGAHDQYPRLHLCRIPKNEHEDGRQDTDTRRMLPETLAMQRFS